MERDFYAGAWQALTAAVPTAIWIAIAVAATIAVFALFHVNTPQRRAPRPAIATDEERGARLETARRGLETLAAPYGELEVVMASQTGASASFIVIPRVDAVRDALKALPDLRARFEAILREAGFSPEATAQSRLEVESSETIQRDWGGYRAFFA